MNALQMKKKTTEFPPKNGHQLLLAGLDLVLTAAVVTPLIPGGTHFPTMMQRCCEFTKKLFLLLPPLEPQLTPTLRRDMGC